MNPSMAQAGEQEQFQYRTSPIVARTTSRSSGASVTKEKVADPETQIAKDAASDSAYLNAPDAGEEPSFLDAIYARFRPFILAALALTILGWWISSTVLQATRHRWCTCSLWCFALLEADRRIGSFKLFGRGSSFSSSPSASSPTRSSRDPCLPFGSPACKSHGSAFRTAFASALVGSRYWASYLVVRLVSSSQVYVCPS
jgi:hypothetical protein